MRLKNLLLLPCLLAALTVRGETLEKFPADPLTDFHPVKGPAPMHHFLKQGDRLAICGDSITEQKMYSRILETYLTVCVPELDVTVRQFGWSGEQATGFLARMTNDCLRFKPTVATTCYGMNDHHYVRYEDAIGKAYRDSSTAIVESFKANGVRVIQGSPGSIGARPKWSSSTNVTVEELNLNLCQLRNIDVDIAEKEDVGFADVFWPMIAGWRTTLFKYGTGFALCGKDGVHPDWAGHLVMAYAFLHAFGLDGDIGTFTVDLRANQAAVSQGHELIGYTNGELQIKSRRYPFCIGEGDVAKDNNMNAGAALVPFNQELNRLMLVVKHAPAKTYKVTWGPNSKTYSAEELGRGINLAAEFLDNPFSENFQNVDDAVHWKQSFETRQIKDMFRSDEAKTNIAAVVERTEKEREPLAAAIKDAFVPVMHVIKIEAE